MYVCIRIYINYRLKAEDAHHLKETMSYGLGLCGQLLLLILIIK